MKRLSLLGLAAFSVALAVVLGATLTGYAADVRPLTLGSLVKQDPAPAPQDPAPAVTPPAPVPTVGDLISGLASAKQDQSDAQATRDAAAKALADADAALTAKGQAVTSADSAIKQALATLGPIIVKGVVYEPTADGGYRSFVPATADTPVPSPPPK